MSARGLAVAVLTVVVVFGAVSVLKRDSDTTPESAATMTEEGRLRIRAFWEAQREATKHRIAGRTMKAARSYAAALAIDSLHEDALYYGGATHLRLGDAAEAQRLWRRLVRVNPVSARAHHQLGELYLCPDFRETFDLTAAAGEFRRALAINQEETGPLLQLAKVALAQAQWDSAGALLASVLASNPESEQALFYSGFLAWRAGRAREAITDFTSAAELLREPEGAPSGLAEGETETGRAMLVERVRCRQFEAPLDGLGTSAGGAADADARYRAAGQMLKRF